MKNFICFGGFLRKKYLYFDVPEYLADSLFIKHRVTVHYEKGDWRKEGEPYIAIGCWVKKKDSKRFEEALGELNNKMLLCGHKDYEDWCRKFLVDIHPDMKDTE